MGELGWPFTPDAQMFDQKLNIIELLVYYLCQLIYLRILGIKTIGRLNQYDTDIKKLRF